MNFAEQLLNFTLNTVFALLPVTKPNPAALQSTRLVAHRGVHENALARENSREAFELAVKNRIWAIEFDVRFTRDHIPVIHHDPDARRLFGRPDIQISQLSFGELRQALPDILSLQEVIHDFGKKIHLMIEIKEDLHLSNQNLGHLLGVLKPLTPQTDYHLLSLEPRFLEPVAAQIPKSTFMDVIWLRAAEMFSANHDLDHGAIAGHFLFFNKSRRLKLKERGKRVGVGFIQTRNILYREIHMGTDFIFTNHPLTLQKYLNDFSD